MISEADAEDYRQQAGEEKWRAFLERRAMMGGPDAPEPCEKCAGTGSVYVVDKRRVFESKDFYIIPAEEIDKPKDCSPCLGTGVQP